MKVLIFNAEHRISLVLAREFAKKGIEVALASDEKYARGFYSKYCKVKIVYSPKNLFDLNNKIQITKPNLIIPVLDNSYQIIYQLLKKYRIKSKVLPMPKYKHFRIMQDKKIALSLLSKVGIQIPYTYTIDEFLSLKNERRKGKFILKPRISSSGKGIIIFEGIDNFEIIYNRYLKQKINRENYYNDCVWDNPIVQEYLEGKKNYSLNLIFQQGKCYFVQMVEHLCYFPQPFGSPIRNRTVKLPADIQINKLIRFFEQIQWNGVVHCDLMFKEERGFLVNEVNPRFWGSLENTIISGYDIAGLILYLTGFLREYPSNFKINFKYEYRPVLANIAYLLLYSQNKFKELRLWKKVNGRIIKYDVNFRDYFPHIVHLLRLCLKGEVI